jgi:hypothetical protein|uniref:Uncharacterized protein n=1 Tax=viral metagenome TaxID=1070528 RepID=A0A6C0IZM1_9ZZZZ
MDYSIKEYSTIYDSLLVAKIKRKTVRQFFLLVLPPEVANLLRKLIQNILPSLIKEFNNEEDPVMNKFFHSKEYDERFLEGPIDNPPLKAEFIFKKTSTSFNKWISQILSENLQIFMNRVHDLSSTKTKEEKPVSTYTEAQNLYDGYLSIRTSAMLLGFGDGNEIEDGTDLISSLAFTIILEAISTQILNNLIDCQLKNNVRLTKVSLLPLINSISKLKNINKLFFEDNEANKVIRFCLDTNKDYFLSLSHFNQKLFYELSHYILSNSTKYNQKQILISKNIINILYS